MIFVKIRILFCGTECSDDKDLIDKKGWGHSSIEQGAEFFNKVNCKKMLITHHAPERTDSELDKINSELPDGIELAFDGMTIEIY